jgi:hypothetical protein
VSEEHSETMREEARRAGRGALSHIDEHAMDRSTDDPASEPEDSRATPQDGRTEGGSTSG